MSSSTTFYADAVLFDMDGTLTDSIAAVEAAWGKVATDLGKDPAFVIAATHGKRAIDNLAQFKPHLLAHEMDIEVAAFEDTIIFYADAFHKHGPGPQLLLSTEYLSFPSLGDHTPKLYSDSSSATSAQPSAPASRRPSESVNDRGPSFATRLSQMLVASIEQIDVESSDGYISDFEDTVDRKKDLMLAAWQLEAASVDRSVRILPGVKRMISSIPEGRYAVATSGAKTYAYGCMARVGITPPRVTITADDKRLKAGKPSPDPFLLAADCLGFDPTRCVVFEDSPSGIRAGVASGATVIAVCTSHDREKISNCGAHYVVDDMTQIECHAEGFGEGVQLKFTIHH